MKRLLFPLVAVLIAGCFQDPSPTGVDVLPGSDLADVVVFDSRADSVPMQASTVSVPIPTYASTVLSVGSTSEYNATGLLRWLSFPSDIAQRGTILSATVTLFGTSYRIGSDAAPIAIDAREILEPWSSFTFTGDSLAGLARGNVVAAYAGSATDSITLALDTALVRSWLVKAASQATTTIYGISLEAGAGMSVVQAFESSDPSLSGLPNPKAPRLQIRMSLGGVDTVITGSAAEDAYAVTTTMPLPSRTLTVHGGLAWRGLLVPDLRAIPAGSIINNVKLYVTIDSAASTRDYRGIDSVLVYEAIGTPGSIGSSFAVSRRTGVPHERVVEGTFLVGAIQRWVNTPSSRTGFVLVKYAETSELEQLRFFGPDADPALQPRIVITWTRRQ